MIVQPPEEPGGEAFVILQNEHTAFVGQLAQHFGNEQFQRLEAADLATDLIARHDEGWTDLDARFLPDPNSGLPYSLEKTPLQEAFSTLELSPTLGESRHPFIGLVSSMHSCGLLTGRFGILDSGGKPAKGDALDNALNFTPPPEWREPIRAMLVAEGERQDRLRAELLANSHTAHLANEALVLRTYKILEFCDIVSLYMQCEHPSRHTEMQTPFVPVDNDPAHDVSVTITPLGRGKYRVSPFPFDSDPFEPTIPGKYIAPQPDGTDLGAVWSAAEPAQQVVRLCA